MVAVGDPAPDFEGPTSLGGSFRLSAHKGHPVVIYFFPQADTPGCTVETKAFRDAHPEFQKRHVTIVGISTDEPDEESKFADKCGIPFGLVADPTKSISTSYGVLNPRGRARRVSFFVGPDGKIVETVDNSSALPHVERAKARFLSG
jgi:thioredoxin-dependent peroxiredoxin